MPFEEYAPLAPRAALAATDLRAEAADLLQKLLRINTVNPPGNETQAAILLRDYLEGAGLECCLLAREPHRANLVARLRGRGEGPSLMLTGHTDTVLADPAEWSVDPWSGELRDGHLWGRGALDMKGHTAAAAVAIAALARDGFTPAGDLVYVAVADEEVGEDYGFRWLCEVHPDAIRTDYCVNEGGGDRIVVDGRPLYVCSTAEKMSSPFRLRVRGRSGHASTPHIADNALVKTARLIERLAALEIEPRLVPETTEFLRAVLGDVPDPREALERVRKTDQSLGAMLEPLLGFTVTPTMIQASHGRNVIPALCDLVCDCRLLPGQTQSEVERVLRDALGDGEYELEWLEGVGGSRSSMHTPLWEAIDDFVVAEEPGARLVPLALSGFTDSHYLREAFGTIAYGFFPMRVMETELAARLIHSADERIAVDDLELGTRFLVHVARAIGSS
jgi:acetylornithine deacetylase/succinyl-diaminopimelate desuccinylase-like protein